MYVCMHVCTCVGVCVHGHEHKPVIYLLLSTPVAGSYVEEKLTH